jgi:hypothetical protein
MDFTALKARYQAAFEAYRQITKRNAESTISGDTPSAVDIEREAKAQRALEEARRELFDAFGVDLL